MNINTPNMQELLQQLQRDPKSAITKAGVNIPEQLIGDPRAMVMHLLQSGQVGGPLMQQILPMLRGMK